MCCFGSTSQEIVQEQITRVLLERLIVNRPHPWGLLITFIELIKNPRCVSCVSRRSRGCMPGATHHSALLLLSFIGHQWPSAAGRPAPELVVVVAEQLKSLLVVYTGTASGRTRSRTARRRSSACSSRWPAAAWAPQRRRRARRRSPGPCSRSEVADVRQPC
jgi:CCR4-Not complex component, Not1